MAIPMRPIAPTMVMKPKGAPKVATARSARPTRRGSRPLDHGGQAEEVERQHERRGHQHEEERRRAREELPTASSRFALSRRPPARAGNGQFEFASSSLGSPARRGPRWGGRQPRGGIPGSIVTVVSCGGRWRRSLAPARTRRARTASVHARWGADLEGLDPLDVSPGLASHADPDGQFLDRLQEHPPVSRTGWTGARPRWPCCRARPGGRPPPSRRSSSFGAPPSRVEHVGHARDAGHDEGGSSPRSRAGARDPVRRGASRPARRGTVPARSAAPGRPRPVAPRRGRPRISRTTWIESSGPRAGPWPGRSGARRAWTRPGCSSTSVRSGRGTGGRARPAGGPWRHRALAGLPRSWSRGGGGRGGAGR